MSKWTGLGYSPQSHTTSLTLPFTNRHHENNTQRIIAYASFGCHILEINKKPPRNQQKDTEHRKQKTSYLHIAFFFFYRYLIGNSFSFRFVLYRPLFFFRFAYSACSSRRFAKRKGVQGLDGERSGSFLFFSSFFFWFWERNGSIDTPSLFIFVFCLLSFFGLGAGDYVADRLVGWFGRMSSSLL